MRAVTFLRSVPVIIVPILLGCNNGNMSGVADTTFTTNDTSTMSPVGTDSSSSMPDTVAMMSDTTHKIDESYPKFPFPPPRASAFKLIPRSYLVSDNTTPLSKILDNELIPALETAGYEYSFYRIKDSGLAVVTRLEKMNENGTSAQGEERYSTQQNRQHAFNIRDYFTSLFFARPGYYRLIVFMLCPYTVTQTNHGITKSTADTIFSNGADRPEEEILQYAFSQRYQCTVLIYQFIKPNQVDSAKEFDPSALTCQQHLEKSNIWPQLLNIKK